MPSPESGCSPRVARPTAVCSCVAVGPVGIIDIGSNSVRLVVYDGLTRTPVPLFNEKAVCALGKGLDKSGHLNPAGVKMALAAVERFVHLARAMGVAALDVLATAAARDATDGPEFIARLEKRCGVTVRLLSGEEEARNAALGVLCSIPEADGMVADLGGGSLELVMVENHRFGDFSSMPLGVLRLQDQSGGNRAKAVGIIDKHLDKLSWMAQGQRAQSVRSGGRVAYHRPASASSRWTIHCMCWTTSPCRLARPSSCWT